jgi:hypothetical protein
MEEVGVVRGGQALEHLLERRADTIVSLISRSPKSIASCLGQSVHLERSVVRGVVFKGDVRVPTGRSPSGTIIKRLSQPATFLLLVTRDLGEYSAAELRGGLRQGMNMKPGSAGTTGESTDLVTQFDELFPSNVLIAEETDTSTRD